MQDVVQALDGGMMDEAQLVTTNTRYKGLHCASTTQFPPIESIPKPKSYRKSNPALFYAYHLPVTNVSGFERDDRILTWTCASRENSLTFTSPESARPPVCDAIGLDCRATTYAHSRSCLQTDSSLPRTTPRSRSRSLTSMLRARP
jgi:hypothetical protein